MDLDFANPFLFNPEETFGIVVLRIPGNFQMKIFIQALNIFLMEIEKKEINGRLWIVEADRIREYDPEI